MGYNWANVTGAVAGDANGYLDTTTMADGAYNLILNAPTFGARHVTVTRTVINAADTPGTITLVGMGLNGPQTEVIIPGAHTVVVASTKFFTRLDTATQAGWVKDAGTADTIVIGWDNVNAVAVSGLGTLHSITINTAGASAIYVGDARGKIASIPANQAAGTHYLYDINFTGYLEVDTVAAASDVTVAHSGSMPSSYSM